MAQKSKTERDVLIEQALENARRLLEEQLPGDKATMDQIEAAAGKISRQIAQDVKKRLIDKNS